jgi:hypothetical protein
MGLQRAYGAFVVTSGPQHATPLTYILTYDSLPVLRLQAGKRQQADKQQMQQGKQQPLRDVVLRPEAAIAQGLRGSGPPANQQPGRQWVHHRHCDGHNWQWAPDSGASHTRHPQERRSVLQPDTD